MAGKRTGLAGERSGLWYEFHRIIERNLPRWVVIENVPGLLSSNEGRDFATILRGLVSCGYGVSWRILDAQYFKLAQRRKRVFIVGSLGSGRSAQVLFESEGMSGNTPPSRETGAGIAATIGASTPSRRNGGSSPTEGHLISPIGFDLAQITSKLNYSNPKAGDPQPPLNTFAQGMVANTLGSYHGHNDPGNGDTLQLAYGVRRLMPIEAERLQGFPDGFTDGFSDSVRYRMLGNAVAVPCAEWIGKRILKAEQL